MQLSIKMVGGKKLFDALKSSKTVGKPLDNGIRKITLYYDGLVKKATVVDTGRLRSSIHHELNPKRASVGTNVVYAKWVEYGSQHGPTFVEARHMEGSHKVLGEGMFAHAWGQLMDWMGKGKHDIHVEIDKEFK
ncbi:MAG: HK97 gp10 family phage protein [Candidatus Peribacteraceae bacterium]|nr:HK97 gp10 family phage protein [Candidatus Peribacteraceae bacterium]